MSKSILDGIFQTSCFRDGDDNLKLEVTAAIIRCEDRFLICQRAADDECAQLWEFPGGKLEEGESYEECILREIQEELQLSIRVIDIFAETMYYFREKEVHFTFFNCEITGGEMTLHVHDDAQWVSAGEMKDFEFMPADVEIVVKLSEEKLDRKLPAGL